MHGRMNRMARIVVPDHRMRNVSGILRWHKLTSSVEIRDSVFVKNKSRRDPLCSNPLDRTRRGVKRMHTHPKLTDEFQIERDFLAYTEGINNAPRRELSRTHAPLGIFLSEVKSFA